MLGATPYSNLWLNTGHDPLGCTFACASGKLVADEISELPTAVPMAPFNLSRG
ncbi:hypothetical protein [Caballeronia sp. DA-9]|uniref:hypothetical protein n=1 Tax=Caballeronia sp. DA-9 TaxID=3436237 RepID=UPI003F6817C7